MGEKEVVVQEEEDLGAAMRKLPFPFKELIQDSNLLLEDSCPRHVSNDLKPSQNSPTAIRRGFRSAPKRWRRRKTQLLKSEAKEKESELKDKSCCHCGTRHTPLWREGPRGAGTLCNACGMRYRTGRLLPEYRPASSPGFKPDIHSNFHRKVMEIRRERNPPTAPG